MNRRRWSALVLGLGVGTGGAAFGQQVAPTPAASSAGTASPSATTADPATPPPPAAPTSGGPTSAVPPNPPPAAPEAGYREVPPAKTPEAARPRPAAPEPAEPPAPIAEPPLPAPYAPVEPPLPPIPRHTAPERSLWAGVKLGWAFPSGNLWLDGRRLVSGAYLVESRPFADFASPGPKAEVAVGARLGRRYNLFVHWEHANLGPGRAFDELGPERGQMNYLGFGFRFSSDPDDVGVLVEAVMGYRSFEASFENGAALVAKDDFLNMRLAFGADIRLSPLFSLSPMIGIGGGFFEDVRWKFADGETRSALSSLDDYSQHSVVTLDLGAHFDLIRSAR